MKEIFPPTLCAASAPNVMFAEMKDYQYCNMRTEEYKGGRPTPMQCEGGRLHTRLVAVTYNALSEKAKAF